MPAEWISASEAAERLGIKPASLYSYVSRGVLTRRKARGSRASLFSASDHPGAAIQNYDFWQNQSSTGAHFDISGTPVAGFNHEINVAAGQLAQATFQAGSTTGTDTLYVRANDGVEWSSWQSFTVTTHA